MVVDVERPHSIPNVGRWVLCCVLCATLVVLASVSEAQEASSGGESGQEEGEGSLSPEGDSEEEVKRAEPGVLPGFVAAVPGLLVHGAGHMAAGDVDTGLELLWWELTGLGLIVASGAPLVLTGASREVVGPTTSVLLVGFGMFANSWLADIYGSTVGGTDSTGRLVLPAAEWEVGYRYIYDPQFQYRNFGVFGAHVRVGAWRVSPLAYVAMDDNNQRLRLEGAYRFWGPSTRPGSTRGSFLDAEAAVTWHGYERENFSVSTGELFGRGRYDLRDMAPSLRGAFTEMGLGLGTEFYTYDVAGLGFAEDASSLLLMRFGFGAYLGSGGEAQVYYDHRHDDFAAGLALNGGASGPAGHFGIEGLVPVLDGWSATWDLQVGSAYIAGFGLRYQGGKP